MRVSSIISVELAERKPFGWHTRLTAEANGISDVNNTQSSEQLSQCETDYAVNLSYCRPVWVSRLAQESRVLAHPHRLVNSASLLASSRREQGLQARGLPSAFLDITEISLFKMRDGN